MVGRIPHDLSCSRAPCRFDGREPPREGAGSRGGRMRVIDGAAAVWVILDPQGEVVVMASGAGAEEFAASWAERGYRAVELPQSEVSAA